MTRRHSLLLALALLMGVAAAADSSSSSSSSSSVSTATNCEICRDTGNCSKAYDNSPGKYCNAWLSNTGEHLACCCATGDVCASNTNYECMCNHGAKSRAYLWILIGCFVVGVLIAGLIATCIRKRRQQKRDAAYVENGGATAYAQPVVYTQGAYPQQGVAYPQQGVAYPQQGYAPGYAPGYGPGYGGGYDDRRYNGRRGMGTGTAVAAGAAGGLLGGLILGDMISDAGAGGGDFGGGGDFAGDF